MSDKKYDIIETMHGAFKTTYNKMYLERKPWEPENPKQITSRIPGTVMELFVKKGDTVKAGQVLIVFKAMKMYNRIVAPTAGKVKKVKVKVGENVPSRTVMIEIE